MRKRRWIWVTLAVVTSLSIGGYLWMRLRPRQDDLAILGPTEFPFDVIPRSTMFEKPLISTNLPIFGKVEIPRRPAPPKGFVDNPLISGILVPQRNGTPRDPLAILWMLSHRDFDFGDGIRREIVVEPGEPFNSNHAAIPEYLACPYVFGRKSRIATMRHEVKGNPIKLRLPASGAKEPVFEERIVKVGPWTATIRAKPWISPAFNLYVDVRITGGDSAEALYVSIERDSWITEGFQIKSGETMPLEWEDWEAKEKLRIEIHAGATEEKEVIIKTTKSAFPPALDYEVRWREGGTLYKWTADDATSHMGEQFSVKPYFAMRVGDWWMTDPDYLKVGDDRVWSDFRSWWNGQVLKATCFKSIRTAKKEVVLPWPGSEPYRKLKAR